MTAASTTRVHDTGGLGQLLTATISGRRFLRFSLRGLIVLVLVIGGGVGFVVHSARVQRQAVVAIEHAGGSVYYDWTWNDDRFISPGKPWAPQRLIDLIGIDYFGHVTSVSLRNPDETTLAHIGRLTRLQQFRFNHSPDNKASLKHLKGLRELTELYSGDAMFTDSDLNNLKGMTKLTKLTILEGRAITDAGLANLEGLTKLTELRLPRTQVTDTGLAHLKDTRVTKAGIDQLKRFLPGVEIGR